MARALCAALVAASAALILAAPSQAYNPIERTQTGRTVQLDGTTMTIDQVVSIARDGARVALTPAARQRSQNAYLLLLEGARENIPIYYFNRGTGSGRQEPIFTGDPLTPENRALIERTQLRAFRTGKTFGLGPEVPDEEVVRAMMAVRVNTMSYEAASPQLTQMLMDFLNHDITPVVFMRGSPGEGDLPQMYQVAAAMVGVGDVYLKGQRMSAAQALAQTGLQPLKPFGADEAALVSTNAYTVGQAALLVSDAQRMLNWSDLIYAMDLAAMNSSVTPLAQPVQALRPFPWLQGTAARVLDMIKGSYLFDLDEVSDTGVPLRIIQDPESLRASSQRNGSAWQAWDALRRELLVQMNSSDHNPAVTPGTSPSDSPELDTPWMRQYYVRGGPNNADCVGEGCEHGFILSNANWEPINVDNQIEAFTNAVANMAVAIDQRVQRFSSTFFTVIAPSDVLGADELANAAPGSNDYNLADLMSEIQTLQNPVPATGNAIVRNVEDLQAAGRIKVARARLAVDNTFNLLAEDLLNASYWLDVRRAQGTKLGIPRSFGAAPTAAWAAFRNVVPWQGSPETRPLDVPTTQLAYAFLQANPATAFYPPAARPPVTQQPPGAVTARKVRPAVHAARERTKRWALTRQGSRRHRMTLRAQARTAR
jgi:histidine ammonia-lyase